MSISKYYMVVIVGFLSIQLHANQFQTLPLQTAKHQATLVYQLAPKTTSKAVVYIHGFNDYVFQDHVADFFNKKGYHFFGIDLHNYGRNITPQTKRYHFTAVDEFYDEINLALQNVRRFGVTDISLIAHSQGGLIASLYAHHHPGTVNRLILNSPFFDFYDTWFMEEIVGPAMKHLSFFSKDMIIIEPKGKMNAYGKSLHRNHWGEWAFDTTQKSITGTPITLGWIAAIHQAHSVLQKGLEIQVPVLVLASNQSYKENALDLDTKEGMEKLMSADVVLDVKDIERYAQGLGKSISYKSIKNAIHDVYLSKKPIREEALKATLDFMVTQ